MQGKTQTKSIHFYVHKLFPGKNFKTYVHPFLWLYDDCFINKFRFLIKKNTKYLYRWIERTYHHFSQAVRTGLYIYVLTEMNKFYHLFRHHNLSSQVILSLQITSFLKLCFAKGLLLCVHHKIDLRFVFGYLLAHVPLLLDTLTTNHTKVNFISSSYRYKSHETAKTNQCLLIRWMVTSLSNKNTCCL